MPDSERGDEDESPVGPADSELAVEPPAVDEIDPFETDPSEHDDVGDFVVEEWTNSTTARERVRTVITRTTAPTPADEIADRAAVSPPTARDELETLAESGIVEAERAGSGTLYRRNPGWYRMQRVHELADNPRDVLESALRSVRSEIDAYQREYDVSSPDDLVLDADRSSGAWDDIAQWRTARVDEQYIRLALGYKRLDDVDRGQRGPTQQDDEPSPPAR